MTTYVYNSDQQLWKVERGSALTPVVDNEYVNGRLSTTAFDRGTTTRTYDPVSGQLETITTPENNVLSYTYDGPLLSSVTWSGAVNGSEMRTPDADLRLGELQVNDSATTYGYDDDGLVTSLTLDSGSMTLTPDPTTGQLDGTTAGAVNDSYTYYPDGSIHHYTANGPSGVLYELDYTRDLLGRVTVKKETIAGTTHTYAYTYWPNGELWQVYIDKLNATGDGPPTDPSLIPDVTYTYDANGNREAKTLADGTSTTATVNAQDQMTDYGQAHYTYDAKGSLQTKTDTSGTTTYNYDELGNLTHVGLPDGTSIDYIIDGRNRRIGKKINGTLAETYLWDGQLRLVHETQGTHQLGFAYANRVNVPDLMTRDGVPYRIITDQLGSVRLVVNLNDGSVAQEIDYDEFGNVTNDTSPGFQPFGFAGGLYDKDTGLLRFGARDYDPRTGRWTAKDPMLFAGGEASLYGYAGNDPLNWVDRDGHFAFLVAMAVGALAGGLINGAIVAANGGSFWKGAAAGAAAGALAALGPLGGALLGEGLLAGGAGLAAGRALAGTAGGYLNRRWAGPCHHPETWGDAGRDAFWGAAGGLVGGALGWGAAGELGASGAGADALESGGAAAGGQAGADTADYGGTWQQMAQGM